MVQLEDFTVLCTNCLVFNFVCQWQRSVQSYNSWRTKEVLTKIKKNFEQVSLHAQKTVQISIANANGLFVV